MSRRRDSWWAAHCIFLTFLPVAAQKLDTQQQMHDRVVALYSFSPHAVSNDERQKKSDEMDAFWNLVKADPAKELPLLRTELEAPNEPPFFYQDGSGLLLSLSTDGPDRQLAADAMAKANLSDVSPPSYFYGLHTLSMEGVDTTAASLHILDDPHFIVPVPQHAMTLKAPDCLMFLLLPIEAHKWIPAVQSRLAVEKDDATRKGLIALFFYAQTEEGDAALKAETENAALPTEIRKDAESYLHDEKQALTMKTEINATNEASLREERRQRLGAVSDEAIDDVQEMTARLIQLRAKAK